MSVVGRIVSLDGQHGYVDELTGERYDSVTSIISATTSKPWLAGWSAKLAATFAVDKIELVQATLAEAGRDAAIDLIKGVAKRHREHKADTGSYVHSVVEALLLDVGGVPSVPDELLGHDYEGEPLTQELVDSIVDGFINFMVDFEPNVWMAEATVADPDTHVAGTLDIGATFRVFGDRVVDVKTGSNIEPSWRIQLARYRRMPVVWLPNGQRADMPPTDGSAMLHLRREYERGYKLRLWDEDDEEFGLFGLMRVLALWNRAAVVKPGRVVYPPLEDGSQPPMLLEDVDTEGIGRCRAALAAAGVRDVADLAALTVDELLAIAGVGESSVHAVIAALAEHQLTVTGDLPCPGGTAGSTRTVARKVVADCPSCGLEVSSARTGAVRFHTAPAIAHETEEVAV